MSDFCVRVEMPSGAEYATKTGARSLSLVRMSLTEAIEAAEKSIFMANVIRISDDAMVDYLHLGLTGNVISVVQAVKGSK